MATASNSNPSTAYTTGITAIDEVFGEKLVRGASVGVFAPRPNSGLTSLAVTLLARMAGRNAPKFLDEEDATAVPTILLVSSEQIANHTLQRLFDCVLQERCENDHACRRSLTKELDEMHESGDFNSKRGDVDLAFRFSSGYTAAIKAVHPEEMSASLIIRTMATMRNDGMGVHALVIDPAMWLGYSVNQTRRVLDCAKLNGVLLITTFVAALQEPDFGIPDGGLTAYDHVVCIKSFQDNRGRHTTFARMPNAQEERGRMPMVTCNVEYETGLFMNESPE